jgi:hypothetical protein
MQTLILQHACIQSNLYVPHELLSLTMSLSFSSVVFIILSFLFISLQKS